MDIVAIILCIYKKWKAALVVSLIGLVIMIFLIPHISFWWVSGIIYLCTILISLKELMGNVTTNKHEDSTDPFVIVGKKKASEIMSQLKALDESYAKGLITQEEYAKQSRIILKIDHLDES